MTVVIRHVRHVVSDYADPDPMIRYTLCGRRWVLGEPSDVHRPAKGRCGECHRRAYGAPA